MSDAYAVRCPVCLQEMDVPKSTPVHKNLKCRKCGSSFEFQNALPATRRDDVTVLTNSTVLEMHDRQRISIIFRAIPVMLIFLVMAGKHANTLDGTGFLLFLLMVFLGTFIGSIIIRSLWMDVSSIRVIAFLMFELLCVYRLVWGYKHDLHQFGIIFIAMLIGGVLYFVRWNQSQSSGSGSGCGGAGCGGCGSGCGGCGGCGG